MDLTDPSFQDCGKARKYLEAQRWPDDPFRLHRGNADQARINVLKGKARRPGVHRRNESREQATVTVGSVMERPKTPLNKWLMAMRLMGASKKAMRARPLVATIASRASTQMTDDVADAARVAKIGKGAEGKRLAYCAVGRIANSQAESPRISALAQ